MGDNYNIHIDDTGLPVGELFLLMTFDRSNSSGGKTSEDFNFEVTLIFVCLVAIYSGNDE